MIILTGDSWGVGEFDKNFLIGGPGIASYITLCEPSVNLSRGAGSNTLALDRLENFLTSYTPTNEDIFLWIVTGPNRCITDLTSFLNTSDSLIKSLEQLLSESLSRANSISKKYNIKLKLIGGLCDLNTFSDSNYSNLEITVPSWGSLLIENYNYSIIEQDFIRNIGPIVKDKYPRLLEEWIELSEVAIRKDTDWNKMSTTYFKTDGAHPDRSGHLILLKTLFPDLAIYFDDYFRDYI